MIAATSSAGIGNASDINDLAAMYIRKGDYERAISDLTNALNLLAHQIRKEVNDERTFEREHFRRAILGFSLDARESVFLDTGKVYLSRAYASSQSEFCFHMFQSPICIQNVAELMPDTASFEAVSFAVLYNLALSWQLSGLAVTEQATRSSLLRKAVSLYEHANRIVKTGHVLDGVPLLYMGLLCNMGTLYVTLQEHNKATACQELLLSAVMCCIQNSHRERSWNSLLDGFLSHVMQRLFADSAAPAA